MVRAFPLSFLAFVLAGAANAQAVDILSEQLPGAAPSQAAAQAADPGRARVIDRGGLSSRGGPDPIGAGRTFSATIGSRIYSTIGQPIGSRIGPRG